MFDYRRKPSLTAKALTIAAIGMGIGFGTCGVTALAAPSPGSFWLFFAWAGAILFSVSLVAAVIIVLIHFANLIGESFQK